MAGRVCTFCGQQIEPGTGTIHVRKDGMPLHFCSRKCRVNMLKLKRVSRKTRWTNEYHSIKETRKQSSKP